MSINPHLFRLTRLHRQLDDGARRSGDALRVLRIHALKHMVKRRLTAVMQRPLLIA